MATSSQKLAVAIVNLGCRVNRVESDLIASELVDAGCCICDSHEAQVVVINTCAVTAEAQAKTRKAVRRAHRLAQAPFVVATGCVASLFADELREVAPGICIEPMKALVPKRVLELATKAAVKQQSAQLELGITQARITPTGRTRPGIKVQDGCDLRCTYCIVWKARGASRSVTPERALELAQKELARGAQELVLTGINLGRYDGCNSQGERMRLPELISYLLEKTDVARLRISSIEPPDVDKELLEVMAQAGERVAPYLHICLQSGCDETLSHMGRIYRSEDFARVVHNARAVLPHIAIETDLIVGFPGETNLHHAQSLAFAKEMAFSHMHVFRYSRRLGTPAAKRTDQLAPSVAQARMQAMQALSAQMRMRAAENYLGQPELVLVQERGQGISGGLFEVLLDEDLAPGSMQRVVPHAVTREACLDARTSTTIKG